MLYCKVYAYKFYKNTKTIDLVKCRRICICEVSINMRISITNLKKILFYMALHITLRSFVQKF